MLNPFLHVVTLKKCQLSFLCLLILISTNVNAQHSSQPENAEQEKQEIERIVVSGDNLDAANRAFYAGDFELAEIEFKQNAKCALRMERNKQAFITGLQNSAIDSSLQSVASAQGSSSSQGNLVANSSSPTSSINGKLANRAESSTVPEHTCADRGYQMYMLGLSQIQLGRPGEAEKNLKTATFLNRNNYDAHYRLALMQLLRNDKQSAEERLANIQQIHKKCGDCNGSDEITARIDFLEKALSGEIKLN